MVIQGLVVSAGGDANWDDYKLSDESIRILK